MTTESLSCSAAACVARPRHAVEFRLNVQPDVCQLSPDVQVVPRHDRQCPAGMWEIVPVTSLSIRPACRADLHGLATLEVEAGKIFRSVGMPEVAEHMPDMDAFHRCQEEGQIWVAEVNAGIAGYVVATVVDGNAHIEQVSVFPAHARQGVGRRLIIHIEAWGRDHGLPATTLTTFRDVPWNGPYYQRLGYRMLKVSEIGTELAAAIEYEASLPGIDRSLRCAMIKAINR